MAQPDNFSFYLKYLTLGDIWHTAKGAILLWLVISVIGAGFILGMDWVIPKNTTDAFSTTPTWVRETVVVAVIFWFARGITFSVPKVSFKAWIVSCTVFGLLFFAVETLPSWAQGFIIFGFYLLGSVLDQLVETGKKNYELLNDQRKGI